MKHLWLGLLALSASPALAHEGVHMHPHDASLTPVLMAAGALAIVAGLLVARRLS
ncbi:peptidase M23 [Sagittula sp. P11]|uniref:peptidase M23 n=1 Tax=Sagittula sp. P11 TaxID=2009329 RepID=UPI000C2CF966|nr:peptidase M23 [Sagittula sp. P11]AUC54855.1 peptidase M23 [Sagittula sp. P11]